jgi:tetratricopeptide (TPR) repeat protein
LLLSVLLAGAPLAAQKAQQNATIVHWIRPGQEQQKNSSQSGQVEEEPPEEDETVAPEKFVLNPLESERNIRIGNYYWHKGNYRAAAGRYERAIRFNPNSQEAFFKLGEAQEKLKHTEAARSAFQKVLQLDPNSKLAHEAKKKLSKG